MTIKSKLENYTGKKINNEDYKIATKMASDDIKTNNVDFGKLTKLHETIKITSMCLSALERCR